MRGEKRGEEPSEVFEKERQFYPSRSEGRRNTEREREYFRPAGGKKKKELQRRGEGGELAIFFLLIFSKQREKN